MNAQRLTYRKRSAIIQAATTEFRSNGYDATSMDRIAISANVSKRTVYNHFSSKEELFDQVFQRLRASSAKALDMTYCTHRPVREQLKQLLVSKMRVINDSNFQGLARFATAAAMQSSNKAQHMVSQIGEPDEGFASWIRAAQADDKLKAADPYLIVRQANALLKEFAFWPQITTGQARLSAAKRQHVVEMTLNMLLSSYESQEQTLQCKRPAKSSSETQL
ncbi:TetR/AcrR family transcriptional regulator [Pseudomonas fluorescens]|jgi:TetR/AcrR family transcriptional regulator of autoinduction and epiphytic fitness|uniref:TetR/AcrR family transcriptional regulator n=1 Tax=Pseudomonas fluorescens TaxID=294 RepID=UPI001912A2EF|nr:TetR/AcrR family transcriptional regulator [Pseudomonas fluorescens]